jgi:hypothetical protein
VDKIIFSKYINYYSSRLLGKDILLLQTKGKDEGNHYIYIYYNSHFHIIVLLPAFHQIFIIRKMM